jgi:hypothetical protein
MSGATAQSLAYKQYLALSASADGLFEYHDGLVVARVAPSPEHARLIARLVRLLEPAGSARLWSSRGSSGRLRPPPLPVSSARRCAALPAGLKVRIEATNRTLIPDVTVVCGALERSSVDEQAITKLELSIDALYCDALGEIA